MFTVTLAGLAISRQGLVDAVATCRAELGTGGYACFVNVHTLTEATSDSGLRAVLAGARHRFADGAPLVWLARAKRQPIVERVGGPDFMAALLVAEPDRVHGLIGGGRGIAERIAARFGVRAVCLAPPFEPFSERAALASWQAFLERCPDRKPPEIVWVGLGAPKQERWVATVSQHAPNVTFFAVGAAFDFLALAIPRAPRLLQRLGLEWMHRLAHSPGLWSRYLVAGVRFAPLALNELR
jgi:N-acetylglucosaminyldiphosphoundecaprenol N-acetyl-beta-D-mannosaminyltransferase